MPPSTTTTRLTLRQDGETWIFHGLAAEKINEWLDSIPTKDWHDAIEILFAAARRNEHGTLEKD